MKSKTPANAALEIIQPQEIIDRHLRPAIAPFKAELLAAAEVDRQLSATMEKEHPNAVKLAAEELFQKATSGDAEAEAAIRAEGGLDEWKRKRMAFFDLSKAKHQAACLASVPLWEKVSAALLSGIEAADREIQDQWAKTCDFLGEPCDLSRWNAYCRNVRNGISRAPFAAEKLSHGSSWQLEAHGLRPLLD
jgi:tyrosyl-tRNA synthetase